MAEISGINSGNQLDKIGEHGYISTKNQDKLLEEAIIMQFSPQGGSGGQDADAIAEEMADLQDGMVPPNPDDWGEGFKNLRKIGLFGQYNRETSDASAARQDAGEVDKKADKHAKNVQYEYKDYMKAKGYKGGEAGSKAYGFNANTGEQPDVLSHFEGNNVQPLKDKGETDKLLQGLKFDNIDQMQYDEKTGAYKAGNTYLKILQGEDNSQYLVSNTITQGETEGQYNSDTHIYAINKNAGELTLVEQQPEATAPQKDEKYNALTDEQKGQVDAQVKNQNWESVYKDFKDGKDDLSNWSQTFQNVGWQPELADAMQEQVKQNVDIISQVDANDGKITNADRERLEKAGIQMTDLSKMLGKPIVNAETRDSIPPLLNENKPQEDKGVPEEQKLEEQPPTPYDHRYKTL